MSSLASALRIQRGLAHKSTVSEPKVVQLDENDEVIVEDCEDDEEADRNQLTENTPEVRLEVINTLFSLIDQNL